MTLHERQTDSRQGTQLEAPHRSGAELQFRADVARMPLGAQQEALRPPLPLMHSPAQVSAQSEAQTASTTPAVQMSSGGSTLDPQRQGWIDDPTSHPYYGTFMAKVGPACPVPRNIAGRIWADAIRGVYKPDAAERQQHLGRMSSYLRQHLRPPASGNIAFYSGRGARAEATRVSYAILEETDGAKLMDGLDFCAAGADWTSSDPEAAVAMPLWEAISGTFAQNINRSVHCFLNRWADTSIFVGTERQKLIDNGISINYHAVASFPHDFRVPFTGTAQIDASGQNITTGDTPLGSDSAARSAIDGWNALAETDRVAKWTALGHRTP
ncbi:MAG: hypothetical protein KC561_17380 [Myxococcales bacterium]|nr:hypothetical protein [Myxococcales bacterium]